MSQFREYVGGTPGTLVAIDLTRVVAFALVGKQVHVWAENDKHPYYLAADQYPLIVIDTGTTR